MNCQSILKHRYVVEFLAALRAEPKKGPKPTKKLVITIASLCLALVLSPSHAQIHQEGQAAVELSAGLVDGFKLPDQDNFGFFTGLAYSKYRTRYSYWKGAVHLNQKYYAYDKKLVPVSQWLGEATYFTRVMGLVGRSWVLNVGGGVAGGYESINQDRRTVEGAFIANPSKWVVGPTLGIEWEFIVSSRTILVARAQEYYLFRSSIIPTRFNAGVAVKFILESDTSN